MTTTVYRTHREATEAEIVAHDHEWRIVATHSLLPAGDGHTMECSCGLVREVMKPVPGERVEAFWWPLP